MVLPDESAMVVAIIEERVASREDNFGRESCADYLSITLNFVIAYLVCLEGTYERLALGKELIKFRKWRLE